MRKALTFLVVAIAVAAAAYYAHARGYLPGATSTLARLGLGGRASVPDAAPRQPEEDLWTCVMHPEIRERAPGTCPKCGMELEKESALRASSAASSDAQAAASAESVPRAGIQLDTRRRQLLGVRTARVTRTDIERQIRAVGIVRYDETRLADVNLRLDGWVRKLHVDSTGQPVRRGQPMLDLYSPDLLATENEYLLALATRDAMQPSQVPDARMQADRLVEAARKRLLLLDLPAEEMQRLDRTRQAESIITFPSPVGGFVIEKPVIGGMRVLAGQTLYRVADLSTVWVEADVFESDAPFARVGASATVTVDARPGESLKGRATYIYPFVEEKTRTLRMRFAFPNPGQRLKPGMFANVEFASSLGTGLVIPTDALLDAGREQLVFVAQGDGYYEPRRVKAGQRLGDRVQILQGLEAGEEIATGAAFFLDSESQLRAATGNWEPGAIEETTAPSGPRPSFTFRTEPDPPRSGINTFEVRVTDAQGQPVTDAQVTVTLHMPAMPSMNMPAMTSEATLPHREAGVYRGEGRIDMSGRWDVTVSARRGGTRLGSMQGTLVAR